MNYHWRKKRKPRPLYWRVGWAFAQSLKCRRGLLTAAKKAAAVLRKK
jgi:hypothetical protein